MIDISLNDNNTFSPNGEEVKVMTIIRRNGDQYDVLLDAEDYEIQNQYTWSIDTSRPDGKPRVMRHDVLPDGKRRVHLLHRDILNAPHGMEVDHINGNQLDERRCNIRLCTHAENMRNRQKFRNCSSQYKGVSMDKNSNTWIAHIQVNGVQKYLGGFTTEIDAAKAYNEAAKALYGEFALPNNLPRENN